MRGSGMAPMTLLWGHNRNHYGASGASSLHSDSNNRSLEGNRVTAAAKAPSRDLRLKGLCRTKSTPCQLATVTWSSPVMPMMKERGCSGTLSSDRNDVTNTSPVILPIWKSVSTIKYPLLSYFRRAWFTSVHVSTFLYPIVLSMCVSIRQLMWQSSTTRIASCCRTLNAGISGSLSFPSADHMFWGRHRYEKDCAGHGCGDAGSETSAKGHLEELGLIPPSCAPSMGDTRNSEACLGTSATDVEELARDSGRWTIPGI
mmetsp:Transcript_139783/g.243338  ORF Transcript_139783/g.243338 Transcript_139783/m.243338 type:complete len:258 (-) Transcript_139783:1784-2557(-)